MGKSETLYLRFQRVRSYDLPPEDILRLSNGHYTHLGQAQKALKTIGVRYLTEDELVLLDLLAMEKSDMQTSEILDISRRTAYSRRKQLYKMIAAYGWWMENDPTIRELVETKLSRLHVNILIPVVHRRRQTEIAKGLKLTRWCVYKKMHDCIRLLDQSDDFMTFLRSLHLGYAI